MAMVSTVAVVAASVLALTGQGFVLAKTKKEERKGKEKHTNATDAPGRTRRSRGVADFRGSLF